MKVARILLDGFMLEDEPGGRGDGGYFATKVHQHIHLHLQPYTHKVTNRRQKEADITLCFFLSLVL